MTLCRFRTPEDNPANDALPIAHLMGWDLEIWGLGEAQRETARREDNAMHRVYPMQNRQDFASRIMRLITN